MTTDQKDANHFPGCIATCRSRVPTTIDDRARSRPGLFYPILFLHATRVGSEGKMPCSIAKLKRHSGASSIESLRMRHATVLFALLSNRQCSTARLSSVKYHIIGGINGIVASDIPDSFRVPQSAPCRSVTALPWIDYTQRHWRTCQSPS